MMLITNAYFLSINEENLYWAQSHYPEYQHNFTAIKRQYNFLLSRALLSHTLKHDFGIDHLPAIGIKKHGKPFFEEEVSIHFNISHSNKTIALIIGNACPIGIDVEQICERNNFEGLLQRTFTESEQQWIATQKNFKNAFFSLWSAKEAYLKADSRGLAGLHQLHFDMANCKIHGSLTKGKLLTTNTKKESIALYFPSQSSLTCYEVNAGNIATKNIDWKIKLSD